MDVEIHPRRKYIFDDYVDVSTKFKPVNGPQDDTKWPKMPSNIRIMPGDFGGASENGLDSADFNFLSGVMAELVGLLSNLDVRVPKSRRQNSRQIGTSGDRLAMPNWLRSETPMPTVSSLVPAIWKYFNRIGSLVLAKMACIERKL